MEGLGLDNILSAEQVDEVFSENDNNEENSLEQEDNTPYIEDNNQDETDDTVEVDFSDLLGNPSESVGSGEKTSEVKREKPESQNQGAPTTNLFFSIAKALKDEGVFPDTSDATLKNIKDAESFRKFWDDQIASSLDERQRRIESALNSGAAPQEVQEYRQILNVNNFLNRQDTLDTLSQESDAGEDLRKKVMYQDFINRGFKNERAIKLIEKSFSDGTDIEDAKEAFESCKDFYKQKIDSFQEVMKNREAEQRSTQEKQYENLKKHILDTDSFYGGVKVDKKVRQKAYDALTKPIHKDDSGTYMTALQKYQKENPMEYLENVAMFWALTDGFKNVQRLTHKKIQEGIKKGFDEMISVLNTTKRAGDGSLDLANTAFDDGRENWSLA
jgi:hypothetical protein